MFDYSDKYTSRHVTRCVWDNSGYFPVLRIRIRDPGLGAFLTPGSGMGESQHPDPGSGMNNPDHIF